jgi:hypothetical protein
MMEDLIVGGGAIVIAAILFVLIIEWIFLRFAIFGTKDKLDQIIKETSKTNKLLEEILDNSGIEQGFSVSVAKGRLA